MKIHWNKILKCFKYAAMDRDSNVIVTMQEPILKQFGVTFNNNVVKGWTYSAEVAHDILRDFRYLIEHDEYELDGTENWEESLQEKPSACERCGGSGWVTFDFDNWGTDVVGVCVGCKGTGAEP